MAPYSTEFFKLLHLTIQKIHYGPRTASVAYRRGLWMMQIDTWPWFHTCWGHMVLTGPQVCKWVKFYIFLSSYKLTSHNLWPSFVTFDLVNMWGFLHYINKPSLVPIRLQLFKWGEFYILSPSYNLTSDDLWPWYVTLTLSTNEGSHFTCMTQLQSDRIIARCHLFYLFLFMTLRHLRSSRTVFIFMHI